MKKSLKALILCGLASLVMFAVIYVSPITAQAATYSTFDIIDIDGNLLSGCSLTVTYSDDSVTVVSNPAYNSAQVFVDDNRVLAFIVFSVEDDHPSMTASASYTFVFNGQTYVGSTSLEYEYDDGNNYGCFTKYVVLSDGDATGYGKEIQELENKIGNISGDSTLTGENRVIEFNEGTALPGNIMAAMANSNGVTLKFTFWYEGFEFTTTITSEDAKRVFNPKVDWCGPCYLAENFPTVWTGKTVK